MAERPTASFSKHNARGPRMIFDWGCIGMTKKGRKFFKVVELVVATSIYDKQQWQSHQAGLQVVLDTW